MKLGNVIIVTCSGLFLISCKKEPTEATHAKPKADFTFTIKNQGSLPDTVIFSSGATNATSLIWTFENGNISTSNNPEFIYGKLGVYDVKLLATNQYGSDSITKQVNITLNKPTANFTFSLDNNGQVPCTVSFTNTSLNASHYKWHFSNKDTSTTTNVQKLFYSPKTYSIKLIATNASGSDSITKLVSVNPILKSVIVYLITPRDKPFNPRYYSALISTMTNLQAWYKTQMGNSKTFVLNPIIVDTLNGIHDSAWYNSYNANISGADPRFYAYYNTLYEMQQLLGTAFNIANYVFLVYVAAPGGGAGSTGFAALGDQDLKGLIGTNLDMPTLGRVIGGSGHELGHSFGLPHPDNQNWQALMWTGYTIYPNCILQQSDRDILNASPFIR